MATIIANKDNDGNIISYRFMVCVGRGAKDYKQIWRTKTVPRPQGLTPAKEKKEIARQADAWAEAQKAAFLKGGEIKEDKEKITFAEFVEEHWWKDHVEDGAHTPSTISFYRHMKNDLLEYFGKKKKLIQIDAETVKRYIKYCNTEARTKKGEAYKPSTVRHHFTTLRSILEYARRFKYIPSDPCQDLSQKEKPKRGKKEIDFLDSNEAREFIAALDREPLYWRTFMNVLITTGLRRGEAVGLQWGDIDNKALTITVQRNVTVDKNSPNKIHIGSTKTGESRTVPISPYVLSLLQQLKTEREKEYQLALDADAFIFCSADPYKPIYPTEPTRWQSKFTERHNLPRISPHDLRHTAATLALEGGANLKQVQSLLGHSDPSTTMTFYAGVTKEAQRRTVEGIEGLLERKHNEKIEGAVYKENYVYKLSYHLVWLINDACKDLITEERIEEMRQILYSSANAIQTTIKKIDIKKDYVHLIVDADPDLTPAAIIEAIKDDAASLFMQKHSELLALTNKASDLWMEGYYLSSCGNVNEGDIQIYTEEAKKAAPGSAARSRDVSS